MAEQRWLVASEAAEHVRMSLRQLHARTAERAIPFRRPAHSRKMIFSAAELDAWLDGAELETVEKPDGSILVRPIVSELATA